MKIRNKLLTIILSVLALGMLITGIVVVVVSNNIVKSQIYSYLYSSSRARAEHTRTFLNSQKETGANLAASSVYRDFLTESVGTSNYSELKQKVEERTARTLKTDDNIFEVFVLDKNGVVAVSSDSTQVGKDKSKDSYYIEGKKDVYIKDVYYSETIGKYTYAVSAPIKDDQKGEVIGVSVIRYDPNRFFGLVRSENGLGKTEENYIINKEKYFLTPSLFLGESVVLKQKVDTENSRACFSDDEVQYITKNGYSGLKSHLGKRAYVEAKDYRGVEIIGTHVYIPETGWCLITKVDRSELLRTNSELLLILSLSFLFSFVVTAVAVLVVSRKITKPLVILTENAKEIKNGETNMRIAQKGNDEISELSRTFADMAKVVLQSKEEIANKVKDQTKDIESQGIRLERQQAAVLNILDDIETEKERAEGMATDLLKFEMAVEGASDHIVITDPEGVVLFANNGVTRITGFDVNEVVGKKAGSKELWGGMMEKSFYENLWKTIKIKKQVFSGIIKNKRKGGTQYEAAASISPILDKDGKVNYFVGIERDITKERDIDRAKTEFVSLASHQLRTPLSAINWYTEMLLNGDAGKTNPDQKNYLEEIYKGNQRMVDLVNSLLNVSRLELGTFEVKPEKFKLSTIAKDVIDELKPQINLKKQDVVVEVIGTEPYLMVDVKLMRIVFQNLLSNSVKYTPNRGTIRVTIKKRPADVIIQVSDTGYGIPEDQTDKIFTKLFRADNVRSMDTEGTGLGLYIIKSILESSGGSVKFKSQLNKGTTFTVQIPARGMKPKAGSKQLD